MKILKLTLVGYRGFQLRQIQEFVFEPHAKTQVILGTNGSGKSSLLGELSPLPAHHTDFKAGGRKEIEIEHLGEHYRLCSVFDQEGRRYYFYKNDENLNPGFTMTVYRELCKEHFGYTQEIHELLIGRIRFHQMSVADRRKWFTMLSETDYTYALKMHQKLREQVRSLKGAIDMTHQRLVQEVEKRLNPEQERQLREVLAEKKTILEDLLSHRRHTETQNTIEQRMLNLDQLRDQIYGHSANLLQTVKIASPMAPIASLEVLDAERERYSRKIEGLNREVVVRCEHIAKLEEHLSIARKNSDVSLEDLQRDIVQLDQEAQTLATQIRMFVYIQKPDEALESLHRIQDSLIEHLQTLESLPRREIPRDEYTQYLQKRGVIEQGLLKAQAFEKEAFEEKTHLEAHRAKGALDCPSCHHRWTPNYDEQRYREVCEKHQRATEMVMHAKTAQTENETAIEACETLYKSLRGYLELISRAPALLPFWEYVEASGALIEGPSAIIAKVRALQTELSLMCKYRTLLKRIDEARVVEKMLLDRNQIDQKKVEAEHHEQSQKLEATLRELRSCTRHYEQFDEHAKRVRKFQEIYRIASETYRTYQQNLTSLQADVSAKLMDELIYGLRTEVLNIERRLSQVDLQNNTIQNLENDIARWKKDMELLKYAEKSLCPKEGLIAKGMMNFINQFVEDINIEIERVWTYPLELKPVTMQDNKVDLDYWFEVKINDTFSSEDVAKTSEGMREIIDRAFIAVSMKYLRLKHYPVWLDEFARSMDPKHRDQAYALIEHLIESDRYSQVFLVSHYRDGYGNLGDAEFLVLCDANVELPKSLTYNQHVVMQ